MPAFKSDNDKEVEENEAQTDEQYNHDINQTDVTEDKENQKDKEINEVSNEAPEVEETEKPENTSEERKEVNQNNEVSAHIVLPEFDYVVPQFKKSDLDDYVSKDVQEYLNIKEYERVNLSNESIRDLNVSMKQSYLELVKKNDEAIKQFDETYAPNENSLDQFKENIAIAQQNELEEYHDSLKQMNDQRYENKELAIQQDIDNYKKQKKMS